MTTALVDRVLADPDNNLSEVVRAFTESQKACWHVDRHVLDVSEAEQFGVGLEIAACVAAIALARSWSEARKMFREDWLLISQPFVIIDDNWITGAPGAPPPHVYICVARDEASFEPVHQEGATPHETSESRTLDSLLTSRERLSRIEGSFEGEPGAWMIEILDR